MCFLIINGILDIQLLLTWGVVRRVFGTSPAPPAGPHQQFAHGPVPVDLSIFSSYAPVPIHADHRSNEKNNKQTKNWWKQNCQYFLCHAAVWTKTLWDCTLFPTQASVPCFLPRGAEPRPSSRLTFATIHLTSVKSSPSSASVALSTDHPLTFKQIR